MNRIQSKLLDERLVEAGYTIPQLMELAGLGCAQAVFDYIGSETKVRDSKRGLLHQDRSDLKCKILVIAGPGNNGGDGLVCARHLQMYGFDVSLWVLSKKDSFQSLVDLCIDIGVTMVQSKECDCDYIIDAIFGFSYTSPLRGHYISIIESLDACEIPIISIDLPSGHDVERGNIDGHFTPKVVISLSARKMGINAFKGVEYCTGRFISNHIAEELGILLPNYLGSDLFCML